MKINSIIRSILAAAIATHALLADTIQLASADQTAAPSQTGPGKESCVSIKIDNANTNEANTITDGTIATAVVRLEQACAANPPAEVEVSAPGIQFDRTKFTFTQNAFEQRVTCRTDAGSAPGKDGTTIDVPVTFKYKNSVPRESDTQNVKRNVRSTGKCSGWGDPHLTTLDGVAYDFHTPGVFRLFESNNFQVQVFQEKCGPGSSNFGCYRGVSVAFGASIVRFFIVDDKISVAKGSTAMQWLSIEKLNGKTDGYRVFTAVDQSTFVDINLEIWKEYKYAYLNVALQVSPYFKSSTVKGLMGNWNGNKNDDLTDSAKLAAAHGLQLTNNLFVCGEGGCTSQIKTATTLDNTAAGLRNNVTILHQGYTAVDAGAIPLKGFSPALKPRRGLRASENTQNAENAAEVDTSTPTAPTLTTTNGTTTNATATSGPDVSQRANELCKQVLTSIPVCNGKYVPNQQTDVCVQKVCVADAVALGDLSVVDSTKLSYLRECRRELDARLASKTASAEETKALMADREALKFGDLSRCAKDCSGRGECLAAGCKCNTGFTGHGCEIAI